MRPSPTCSPDGTEAVPVRRVSDEANRPWWRSWLPAHWERERPTLRGARGLLAWVSRAKASRHLMVRSTGRLKEPLYRFALRDHREPLEKTRELLVVMPA